MSNDKEARRFQGLSVGRAVELAEQIGQVLNPDQIDLLLELVCGLCDEMGDPERFEAAMGAMRHLHAMRNDDAWVAHVVALQMVSQEGRPMQ
jgi:hypothetical protein